MSRLGETDPRWVTWALGISKHELCAHLPLRTTIASLLGGTGESQTRSFDGLPSYMRVRSAALDFVFAAEEMCTSTGQLQIESRVSKNISLLSIVTPCATNPNA